MNFGPLTTLDKFRQFVDSKNGVLVMNDTANGISIHKIDCTDVKESEFIQKVITENGTNRKYFSFNNTTHALRDYENAKLCTKCLPHLAEKTISLNTSGAFLQILSAKILEEKTWGVQPEFPVGIAPFIKDPMKYPGIGASGVAQTRSSIFQQAVNESQNQFLKKETSIDIVGTMVKNTDFYVICTEIKKLNPSYVDWCFLQEGTMTNEFRVVTKSLNQGGLVNLLSVNPTDTGNPALHIQIEKFTKIPSFNSVCCHYGVSLHKDESGNYKHQNTSLNEAARQCVEGTYGMIIDAMINQVSSGMGYVYSNQIFIPMLITNANLFLCKYNSADLDMVNGEISKIDYVKRNHVIYECPLPMSVQFPNAIRSVRTEAQQKAVIRWPILIVNITGLTEFLEAFKRDILASAS